MRIRSRIPGASTLAALLLMLAPGLHVVHADPTPDGPMSVGVPASLATSIASASASASASEEQVGVCKVVDDQSRARTQAAVDALRDRVQQAMEADGDGPSVVLNGRGFSYSPPRDPYAELQAVQQEAARLKAAQRAAAQQEAASAASAD